MIEYRERNEREPLQTPVVCGAGLYARKMESYKGIASIYGFEDLAIGESTGDKRTIEQEYREYIGQPPSTGSVDILKYWEVDDSLMVF